MSKLAIKDVDSGKYFTGENDCGFTWSKVKSEAKTFKVGDLLAAKDFFVANNINAKVVSV